MSSFWENSWESVSPSRITEYLNTFNMETDDLINILHQNNVHSVCDAGCGCGIYALKLALHGFCVSGFDVSSRAVEISQSLLNKAAVTAELKTASILATGFTEKQFDCVISRDVLDHMSKADAFIAVKELCRITKDDGIVLLTLDSLDEEYITEPHNVNMDGDYVYTGGKWKGMVFHPYNRETVCEIIPTGVKSEIIVNRGELTVFLRKSTD